MAKQTTLTDDTTGNIGATPRYFSIAGTDYVVDLTDDTYTELLRAVEPYRSVARIAKRTRSNPAPKLDKDQRVEFRMWAEAKGYPLPRRGRFPTELLNEFALETDLILV